MDDKELFGTKYPKSISSRQCIGPCYESNTMMVHPQTLEFVTNKKHPFCPTDEWEYTDPETKKSHTLIIDGCNNPTDKIDIGSEDIEMNILIPKYNFSCKFFLKVYYNINSFDSTIIWIKEHTSSAFLTKSRNLECALKLWGITDQFVITDDLVDIFIIITKKNIKIIYDVIYKYIIVDKKNDSIKIGNSVDNKDKYTIEKTNYILKKILDKNAIYKLISEYQDKFYSKWNDIPDHLNNFNQFVIKSLEQKLINTISNNNH